MSTERLPTYNDSIRNFVAPPDYASVAAISAQSPFKPYYNIAPLELVPLTPCTQEDQADMAEISFNGYSVQSKEEIQDTYYSLQLIMNDKVQQIDRNADFIQKKIRTRYENYFIDKLRESTFADFMRIKYRIVREEKQLDEIFDVFVYHNELFKEVNEEIKVLERDTTNTNTSKEQSVEAMKTLSEQLIMRGKIVKNLESIQQRISELSCEDDVGYVLKERARVYNDAKDFVRRQTTQTTSQ